MVSVDKAETCNFTTIIGECTYAYTWQKCGISNAKAMLHLLLQHIAKSPDMILPLNKRVR